MWRCNLLSVEGVLKPSSHSSLTESFSLSQSRLTLPAHYSSLALYTCFISIMQLNLGVSQPFMWRVSSDNVHKAKLKLEVAWIAELLYYSSMILDLHSFLNKFSNNDLSCCCEKVANFREEPKLSVLTFSWVLIIGSCERLKQQVFTLTIQASDQNIQRYVFLILDLWKWKSLVIMPPCPPSTPSLVK